MGKVWRYKILELYFAGGCNKNVEDFMFKKNCKRLFSYYRDRSSIKKYIEKGGKQIFLDSGAFSAYNSGATINIDELCNYANSISEYCTFIACLDVIGDAEQSYANYIYMRRKLKEPNKLIACFHANEPIEYLYKYLTYVDSYGKLSNLALGGVAQLPGSSIRPFLDMCEPICSKYPDVWIHAFGLTNFPLVECYSFIDSIDSTKHIMQPIYGHLILPPKYKCISIGKNSRYKDYISTTDNKIIKTICSKINLTIQDLIDTDWCRSIFYVEVMLEWLKKYNEKNTHITVKRRKLF